MCQDVITVDLIVCHGWGKLGVGVMGASCAGPSEPPTLSSTVHFSKNYARVKGLLRLSAGNWARDELCVNY